MLVNYWQVLILLGFMMLPGAGLAAGDLPVSSESAGFQVADVTAYTLPNGLKILLYPEHSKPEITVNILYKTGSKHELTGEMGMAHLLEHMLFKRTPTRSNMWQELENRGARFNASTNADRTSYYETLNAAPGNLEFALALEADRMLGTLWTDEELAKEISVVKSEWEQADNSSFQPLLKEMLQVAYPHHAYGRETLGVLEGVLKTKANALRNFYQRRYRPQLAVLTIGGDFTPAEARTLIEKYFAPLNPVPMLSPVEETSEVQQKSERQVILHRQAGAIYVGLVYHAGKGSDPEFVAAQALIHNLGSGSKSLLQKELVKKGLASEAFGFVQQASDPGFIAFIAKPIEGQDPLKVALKMARLIENPPNLVVSAEALQRFHNENNQAWSELLRDPRALTMQLGEYEILGDWRLLLKEQQTGRQLRPEDMQSVAQWLKSEHRTLGILDREQAKKSEKNARTSPTCQGPAWTSPACIHAHKPSSLRMFKRP